MQGVRNVKKSSLKPYYIFVAPPSIQELEKRLRGRGTEKEEDIKRRLANAQAELDYGKQEGNFDMILVNDNLDKAFETLVTTMKKWYSTTLKDMYKPSILCGPTGVDKNKLLEMLLERFPNVQFDVAKVHTTTAKKKKNGSDDDDEYHVTAEEMKKMMEQDKLLYHQEKKDSVIEGVTWETVNKIRCEGKICVIDTDVRGIQAIRKSMSTSSSTLDPHYLFVAPLSMDVLESALTSQGAKDIPTLLKIAQQDLEYGQVAGNFDRVFFMANLGATFEDMVYAFKEWYPHLNEEVPEDATKSCTCTIS